MCAVIMHVARRLLYVVKNVLNKVSEAGGDSISQPRRANALLSQRK
jgi:hypothetical protein